MPHPTVVKALLVAAGLLLAAGVAIGRWPELIGAA